VYDGTVAPEPLCATHYTARKLNRKILVAPCKFCRVFFARTSSCIDRKRIVANYAVFVLLAKSGTMVSTKSVSSL
jgi:hypothetical protein